uniref:Uncharacterized protein n=1 Tax=Setaria viridis TaxID=4556 RepID=A0A4U6UUS1_SETVI|nr:hypothetical protein SEVIR_5G428400v2 [Setaria viridis]
MGHNSHEPQAAKLIHAKPRTIAIQVRRHRVNAGETNHYGHAVAAEECLPRQRPASTQHGRPRHALRARHQSRREPLPRRRRRRRRRRRAATHGCAHGVVQGGGRGRLRPPPRPQQPRPPAAGAPPVDANVDAWGTHCTAAKMIRQKNGLLVRT